VHFETFSALKNIEEEILNHFTESSVEQVALYWLEDLYYTIFSRIEITPKEISTHRGTYSLIVLNWRLHQAIQRLNPQIPEEALEEALRKLVIPETPSLISNNHIFHKYLRYDITTKNTPIRIAERPVAKYDFGGNQCERYYHSGKVSSKAENEEGVFGCHKKTGVVSDWRRPRYSFHTWWMSYIDISWLTTLAQLFKAFSCSLRLVKNIS
jgi:hypothetical protein